MYTELAQRAFDGKWVLWGVAKDPNLDEEEELDNEWYKSYGVSRWVPLKIYDHIITIEYERNKK